MPSKGVTKTGDAFCLSCGAGVEPGAARCESCYSQLDEEVKAFKCPRCGKVLELGTDQCPRCSMKFKVKTIRPSDAAEDDAMLSRLIDWGRPGTKDAPEAPSAVEPPASPALTGDEAAAVSELLGQMSELADLRAEVASGMGTGLSEARVRIARLSANSPRELPFDDLEAELRAVSQDMARIAEVLSRAGALSDALTRTFSMPGVAALAVGHEVSLDLPQAPDAPAPASGGDLSEREELLRKREEMVDRKIAAYAQKKKQLEALEEQLATRGDGAGQDAAPDGRVQELQGQLAVLARRVRSLHEALSDDGACDDPEPCLSSLEGHVRSLVTARSELEQTIAQMREGEDEVKALLRTLDNLLGQLPAEIIDRFSKSEEFKLYERVLDRMRI